MYIYTVLESVVRSYLCCIYYQLRYYTFHILIDCCAGAEVDSHGRRARTARRGSCLETHVCVKYCFGGVLYYLLKNCSYIRYANILLYCI